MKSSRLLRTVFLASAVTTVSLAGITGASAAAPAKPTADCKVPVFSVSQTTAMPGTEVTVSGKNFSGCSAQGNPAKPTAVLTVKVGVITAAKVQKVLATTKTDASGSFSVKITVPSVPAGGEPKIALAAAAQDPATTLTYEGVATIEYSKPAPTSSPAAPTTAASSTPATSTPEPSSASSTSSVDVPTAVPAGTGGFGAPTSSAQIGTEIGLGAAGIALVALGGYGATRRRVRQH